MSALDHGRLANGRHTSKMGNLGEWLIKLESQSRHDNLLFDGVNEIDPEDYEAFVRNILRINLKDVDFIHIVRCHRLGPKRNALRLHTIITKFQRCEDRMKKKALYANRPDLANATMKAEAPLQTAIELDTRSTSSWILISDISIMPLKSCWMLSQHNLKRMIIWKPF